MEFKKYFSPEQLKHKIIIKGKKLKNSSISEDLASDVGEVSDEDEAAESTAAHMMDLEQSLSEDSRHDSTKQKKKKKNVSTRSSRTVRTSTLFD